MVELSQLAVPYLTETKGNIVNVSSIAGLIPIPACFAYAMSKAALDQFTKCIYLFLFIVEYLSRSHAVKFIIHHSKIFSDICTYKKKL